MTSNGGSDGHQSTVGFCKFHFDGVQSGCWHNKRSFFFGFPKLKFT